MALQAGSLQREKDWENFFQKAGIPENTSKTYAKRFKNNPTNGLITPSGEDRMTIQLELSFVGQSPYEGRCRNFMLSCSYYSIVGYG